MTHTKNKDKNHKKNIDVYIVYLFGFFSKMGSGPKYFGYNTVLIYFSFSGVPLQGNSKQPYMRLPFFASHTKNVAEVKQSDHRFRLYVCIYVYECMFFPSAVNILGTQGYFDQHFLHEWLYKVSLTQNSDWIAEMAINT